MYEIEKSNVRNNHVRLKIKRLESSLVFMQVYKTNVINNFIFICLIFI